MRKNLIVIISIFLSLGCSEKSKEDTVDIKYSVKDVEKSYGNCADSVIVECAQLKMSYPVFDNLEESVLDDSLNMFVQNKLLIPIMGEVSNFYPSVDSLVNEFFNDFKAFRNEYPDSYQNAWSFERYIEVVNASRPMISIMIAEYSDIGGAHPNNIITYENFHFESGKIAKLEDLFIPDFEKELTSIAEGHFRKMKNLSADTPLDEAGYFFEDAKFSLNRNFMMSETSLVFYFNNYEIAPYVEGPTELFIPLKEIKHLIKL